MSAAVLLRWALPIVLAAACSAGAGGHTDAGSTVGGIGAVSASRQSMLRAGQDFTITTASALFFEVPDTSACRPQTLLGCVYLSCPRDARDAGPGPAPPFSHAGRITLTAEGQTIGLDPGASGRYLPRQEETPLWKPGSKVALLSDGAQVPAFSGSLLVPDDVTLTRPAPPAPGALLAIRRDIDLEVAWSDALHGEVALALSPDDPGRIVVLTCAFPASARRGTVSKALLARLPAGQGLVTAFTRTQQEAGRGGWQVTYSLSGVAHAPGGPGPFLAAATFE